MAQGYDLVIIGNGPAGNNAAEAARLAAPDLSILMISRETQMEYSAPALPDYLADVIDLEGLTVNHLEHYEEYGIDLRLGDEVRKVDPGTKTITMASGEQICYHKLIFATGSFPIRLRQMKGTELPGNFMLKTLDDVEAIKAYPAKRAVVVGSGAIGLEGGMALKERGYEAVTIVEALDWINKRSFDQKTAERVVKALNDLGVEVLSGEAVEGVLGDEKVTGVKTTKRTIPCDLIIWGIGVRPEVTLAKETGVELGELGGIKVDGWMRTSIPNIYACGDCTESTDQFTGKPALNLFWEPAARGGMAAGTNAAGGDREFAGSFALFLTYIGDVPVVAVGKTGQDLEGQEYLLLEEDRPDRFRRLYIQNGRLTGIQMVNTMEDMDLLLDKLQKDNDAQAGPERADWGEEEELSEEISAAGYLDLLKRRRRA